MVRKEEGIACERSNFGIGEKCKREKSLKKSSAPFPSVFSVCPTVRCCGRFSVTDSPGFEPTAQLNKWCGDSSHGSLWCHPRTISHFSSAKMRFSLLFSVLSLLFLLFASVGAFPRGDFVRISKRQVVVKDTNDLPKWYGK
ncbi:hypothetical protein niasHT_016872 [Heterodera trifolii]|uniref:Uncharacterized protein n=1 Tax=Heterodera trifolii TaxID=157864 RepID=A0ABD2KTA1_9BILA